VQSPRNRRRSPGTEAQGWFAHLEDLRRLLIKCAAAWLAASFLCFLFTERILVAVFLPLELAFPDLAARPEILALNPAGPFLLLVRLAALAGLVLSLPLVIIWSLFFLLPALREGEKKLLVPLLASAVLLFLAGGAFAFFGVLPPVLRFFAAAAGRVGTGNAWGLEEYTGLVLRLTGAFGAAFEFPVVVSGLVWLGFLDRRRLSGARPYAVVLILVLAALLTPPDVVSQVLLAVPLLILFEICVLLSGLLPKLRRASGDRTGT